MTTSARTPILGLHHVTATVEDAQDDLNFAADLLGLRLVKQTVNFDNHHVFHFYYGNRVGTPGTIWTTFPYKGHGVRPGSHGSGQVTATAFSVPAAALPFWEARLKAGGVTLLERQRRFGDDVLVCLDPSGLVMELIACSRDAREPWLAPGMDRNVAVRGLHSVTATVRASGPTLDFVTAVLGFDVEGVEGQRTRVSIGERGPGRTIDFIEDPAGPSGINGLGTVHHVAIAVRTAEEQLRMREQVLRAGGNVTPVRDRQYFQSIYFREPGGVLFEIATSSPGFEVDEPVETLGTALKLPPWEEPSRHDIERGLPRIELPASAGAR